MKKKIKRLLQIIIGTLLILPGIVMLFTPGPGVPFIVLGVMLVSPHHGHKVFVRIEKIWWEFVDYLPKDWQKKIHLSFPKNWGDKIRKKFHEKFHKK